MFEDRRAHLFQLPENKQLWAQVTGTHHLLHLQSEATHDMTVASVFPAKNKLVSSSFCGEACGIPAIFEDSQECVGSGTACVELFGPFGVDVSSG